ncbi:MAG: LytTR family DNA-binding domain-containing protein [Coprobacillus sp.]
MKIGVCDDESWFLRIMTEYLEEYKLISEEPFSIHTFQDPILFLADSDSMNYDIVFLDIEMESINGIEVARQLKFKNPNLLIFFITSHMQYVQDSYTVKAFQYLSKPLEDKEFFMKELTRAIREFKNGQATFEFNLGNGPEYIQTSNIIYLSTSYKNFKLQTVDGSHFGNLKSVISSRECLLQFNFFKIHRSTTINLAHVTKFDREFVTMSNDEILPISREKTKEFRKAFLKYKNVRNVDI